MKRILFIILLIKFSILCNAQKHYFGINIFPIVGKTIELGYTIDHKPKFSSDLYAGYVFNSPFGNHYYIGTPYYFDRKSGFFIKTGVRFNIRKDINKFSPFIGLNIVNSIAIESATYDPDYNLNTPNEKIDRTSYNLGINGLLGITGPSIKRFNVDFGLQIGWILINNLISKPDSYMPGMGIYMIDYRAQIILRLKYQFK